MFIGREEFIRRAYGSRRGITGNNSFITYK
jgi:hypothetical protein